LADIPQAQVIIETREPNRFTATAQCRSWAGRCLP